MPKTDEAVFSIDIKAPIERVFEEITTTNRVQPAYFAAVLESTMEPGAPLAYHAEDRSQTYIEGEVVEVSEPNRFAHTFRFTHLEDPASHVLWELESRDANLTRVVVTHSRLAADCQTRKHVSSGWPTILTALQSWIETGTIPDMSEEGAAS